MGKLPASLFYWGDFIRDPDLRRCSNAAVGVWIRLLCLMFECEPKGILATRGIPWTDDDIALAVGGRWEETNACLTELVTKGVASRNAAGALMNRRMYRDEKVRDDTRERVRRFREKQNGNAECNDGSNAVVRECTETETESEDETLKDFSKKPHTRGETKAQVEEQVEAIYLAYPRKVGRAVALKAIHKAIERLGVSSPDHAAMDAHEARRWLWKRATEYASSLDGSAQDRAEFRPHPSTWFNQERYFDDTKEWNRIRGGNSYVNGNGSKPSIDEQADAHLRTALRNEGIEDGPDQAGDHAPRGGDRQSSKPGNLGDLGTKPAIILAGKADWGI